jgi:hypothetical protein
MTTRRRGSSTSSGRLIQFAGALGSLPSVIENVREIARHPAEGA